MKTITLDTGMTFTEAIQYIIDGKCIGIKPDDDIAYLVIKKGMLCWKEFNTPFGDGKGEEDNTGVLIELYSLPWYPVVIDHREII